VNGKEIWTSQKASQLIPSRRQKTLCEFSLAQKEDIFNAIEGALQAKHKWQSLSHAQRASVFLKAADLLTSPAYRYKVMAATMLGQGKTVWQAEIDSIAELADFWRFNCSFAEEAIHSAGIKPVNPNPAKEKNTIEFRPLDGFVSAISPFNFTAIGGNLASAPALMGNVVLWKPSASAVYSNYLVFRILQEAGLPNGVVQFLPSSPTLFSEATIGHAEFGGMHFTGSSAVFSLLWKEIAQKLDNYRQFPRIVGETGGKNMHFIHHSANLPSAVHQTIRAAFEYQGQKCSACSRLYLPESISNEFLALLLEETAKIKVGHVEEMQNFVSAVINQNAYDKITGYIEKAKELGAKVLAGGEYSCEEGFYIQPTILQVPKPDFLTMKEEIFGPVLSVYIFPDAEYQSMLEEASRATPYALTAGIFATDLQFIQKAKEALRFTAGNLYINDKCTGAVVGQQPFGGAKKSGTNDKAGSLLNLLRWTSPLTVKESFCRLDHWSYPSNAVDK
jgi:1-pyrroline-5-carboxylate dehydrogenase